MHNNDGASRAARVRAVHADTTPFDNPEQFLRALYQKLIPPPPLQVLQTPLHPPLHSPRHRRLNKRPRAVNAHALQLCFTRRVYLTLNDANDAGARHAAPSLKRRRAIALDAEQSNSLHMFSKLLGFLFFKIDCL